MGTLHSTTTPSSSPITPSSSNQLLSPCRDSRRWYRRHGTIIIFTNMQMEVSRQTYFRSTFHITLLWLKISPTSRSLHTPTVCVFDQFKRPGFYKDYVKVVCAHSPNKLHWTTHKIVIIQTVETMFYQVGQNSDASTKLGRDKILLHSMSNRLLSHHCQFTMMISRWLVYPGLT